MPKKYVQIVTALLMMFVVFLIASPIKAAENSTIEVGEVKSIGKTATVPVILRNTTYITSGQVSISLSSDSNEVSFASFKPTNLFAGDAFRTVSSKKGNQITIDFISNTGKEQRLTDKRVVIGYITYNLSSQFTPGQSVSLKLLNVVAKGRNNADLNLTALDGKIENRMMVGDVTSSNKVGAPGAIRVLQHVNGKFITNREQFLAADVDADGILTQTDAMQILDYATGKRSSFLAIGAKDMNTAVLKSEYSDIIEACHGRGPYQYRRTMGSFPAGLKLNETTGELTGIPTRAGNYTFTIQVTDAVGDKADRQFTLQVVDSNIISVEKLNPINVKRGETPVLPAQVTVTYKDKTTGKENVTWEKVDTSKLGAVSVKGTIGNTGFTLHVTVNVVNNNYINKITVGYYQQLNVHTIVVDTTADVYVMTVNNMTAHYEGNDQFSLASTSFRAGSSVTIRLYDKYGNLLETRTQKLEIN